MNVETRSLNARACSTLAICAASRSATREPGMRARISSASRRRGDRIVPARDHERGCRDAVDRSRRSASRMAAQQDSISLGGRRAQHPVINRRRHPGGGAKAGSEPSAHGRIGQRFDAGRVHLNDPFLPHRDRCQSARPCSRGSSDADAIRRRGRRATWRSTRRATGRRRVRVRRRPRRGSRSRRDRASQSCRGPRAHRIRRVRACRT